MSNVENETDQIILDGIKIKVKEYNIIWDKLWLLKRNWRRKFHQGKRRFGVTSGH